MTKKIVRIISFYSSVFGHCVKQNTKYNLKIKQIYRKLNKWNIRGSSKCAPSAVLQQTIKIKK